MFQETVLWISIYPRVERCHRSTVSIVNFEHIPHLALAFLLLILSTDLSSNDDKRLQTFDKITSYPYGTNVCRVCKSEMLCKYKWLILRENLNWPYIPDNPYRILITGDLGSGKATALLNLISNQPDIHKISLYAKDPYEAKYQYLISKWESIEFKQFNHPKAFEYSNDMRDVYKNIWDNLGIEY